ncbi:MAG: exodeoxyribonuclease VII large subunit [Candidatus Wildermuthbacteria bacterium]|nr:exodeoxyribonuclease VII large subunit [Candidatus Wildermuthbacteria bacterium]
MEENFPQSVPSSYRKPEVDADGRVILSVEECHFLVNEAVSKLGILKVRGEISNIAKRKGAMAFFDLKDSNGKEFVLKCALFGWQFGRFNHLLQEGMEVVITGKPNLYKTGNFSIVLDAIEPYGEGAWKRALEELKKKLAAKGYFDPARKRALPEFIQKIGLITSEDGDAIFDFKTNLGEYGFQIFFYGVWVEGEKAEESIASAFEWFNKNRPDMDVLVLIRGGGGFENLKVFHSEKIAEAIITSRIPVLCGIGHEKDETIAGDVADKNCSTPTAAAVFLRTSREELMRTVEELASACASRTEEIFEERLSLIATMGERLHHTFGGILEQFHRIENNFMQLIYAKEAILQSLEGELKTAHSLLLSLNPENILQRGYSVVYSEDRKVIKRASDVKKGDKIFTKFSQGEVGSQVENIIDTN